MGIAPPQQPFSPIPMTKILATGLQSYVRIHVHSALKTAHNLI
jgi:hypothetical protein